MIPLKLQVKNFLSYGSPTQTIDFTPYHLICLSGKNGHGKSALLDAITWAVWGQARKTSGTSKADEGLIRLGQLHMMVALDFMCNGHTYRVRREFSYDRGKGVTQLDFGIVEPESERMRTLTDKTIRATQDKLEATIGLDFETFINSVFLRQGNSNEFSKKSPKERKEILSTILGLARYELIRKKALEKSRDSVLHSAHIKRMCEHLSAEVAPKTVHAEQLHALQLRTEQITQQEQHLTTQLNKFQTVHQDLITKQHAAAALQAHQSRVAQQIEQHLDQFRMAVATWRSKTYQLQESQSHGYELRKISLEAKLSSLQTQLAQYTTTAQQLVVYHTNQQAHLQMLQQHYFIDQQALQTLAHQINGASTEQTLAQTAFDELIHEQKQNAQEIAKITAQQQRGLEQPLHVLEQQFERRKRFYHTFVARGNHIAQELKQLKLHIQQLRGASAMCPLCTQQLEIERQTMVLEQLLHKEYLLNHQFKRLTHIIERLKVLLTDQNNKLSQLRQGEEEHRQRHIILENLRTREKQIAQLVTQKKNDVTQIQKQLQQLQKEYRDTEKCLTPLDQRIKNDATYQILLAEIATHEERMRQQQKLQEELQHVQQELIFLTQKQVETAHQAQHAAEIHALAMTIRQLRSEYMQLTNQLELYKDLPAKLTLCHTELEQLKQTYQELMQEKESLARQHGSLTHAYERICQQEKLLAHEQTKLKQLEIDGELYQQLGQALSKDGIQGLLIEQVVPDIEAEANHLLSQLTNNQAHLMIESLRDLKGGGTRETLDIKISDAMGIRPYEMFSGGEAFRIDFAIRLALSKLLARRNGTSLQTLIIDEGFGSQDEEGLNYIMECLYAIQQDFAKIIIVSHLPTMKDQFPVHFHVNKGPRGSMVQVIEQG